VIVRLPHGLHGAAAHVDVALVRKRESDLLLTMELETV
jgi:hypothetical protein